MPIQPPSCSGISATRPPGAPVTSKYDPGASSVARKAYKPEAIHTARSCRPARATYLLIANPHARNGRGRKKLAQLRAELERRGVNYDLALCQGLDHARMLSAEANRSGYDVVVGVGGDGTINRVLNGFFDASGRRLSSARLGVIHVGTSPDFCRSYGIPVGVPAAVDALLAGLARPIRARRAVRSRKAAMAGSRSRTSA